MIPFMGFPYGGIATSAPAGDLEAVLAGMVLSWRDDFNAETLNAGRWNILAEPGQGQSSALGTVLDWPDHWGSYTHDPALVTLADGVLRLGWGVTGGNWRAGGITSASQYGAASSAKASSIYGLTRCRCRVPVTAGNSFGAVWQMPVENAYGNWPASGEIDGMEWTQSTNLDAGDRKIGYANVILSGGSNSRNTSALSSPAFDILDGQFHEWAWWRRETGSGVAVSFYVDDRLFGEVEIAGSASLPLTKAFYFILSAQLGWWGTGLPPDSTLASQHFEIDWIEQWTATTPPVQGWKPTAAPILQAKGLSLIWQDRLGETDAPTDDRQFFQATTGNRISEDPVTSSLYSFPGENNRRLSFVTYDGRPCIKATYFANAHGWLNHRTQYLPNRYRELGLCVDFKYPADFNLRSVTGGDIHGKSMFGLLVGHVDFQRPGVPSSRAWAGEVYWPEDQWGGALGLNTRYRVSQPGNISYRWYPHVIGAYVNGADRFRLDKYSNLYSIPGYVDPGSQAIPTGVWHRLEIYGKVDTNRRDGVLEMWVDGTLRARAANLDLGGWVGNRGLAARTVGNGTNGDGSLSAGTGQLVGSSGGGWRFCGIFQRDMLGGSTSLQSLVPQYGGAYYAYNWRVYGRV